MLQAGATLERLLPGLAEAMAAGGPVAHVSEWFEVLEPPDSFLELSLDASPSHDHTGSALVLRSRTSQLHLMGQIVALSPPRGINGSADAPAPAPETGTAPALLFMCSPGAAMGSDALQGLGVALSDLPLPMDPSWEGLLRAERQQQQQQPACGELRGKYEALNRELQAALHQLHDVTLWLDEQRQRADTLLYQMLPPGVAQALKAGERAPASEHEEATVLFSDVCGFTEIAAKCHPLDVCAMLDELYHAFDRLLEERFPSLYKVETIGDAYMLVGNVTSPCHEHADQVLEFAVEMHRAARRVASPLGAALQIRVGVHSGPVVSGVVGKKMPRFCLFGDTVNTASRMESHGLPGHVHISAAAYACVRRKERFSIRERGVIEVKGKGPMTTYLIVASEDASALADAGTPTADRAHHGSGKRHPSFYTLPPAGALSRPDPVSNGGLCPEAAAAAALLFETDCSIGSRTTGGHPAMQTQPSACGSGLLGTLLSALDTTIDTDMWHARLQRGSTFGREGTGPSSASHGAAALNADSWHVGPYSCSRTRVPLPQALQPQPHLQAEQDDGWSSATCRHEPRQPRLPEVLTWLRTGPADPVADAQALQPSSLPPQQQHTTGTPAPPSGPSVLKCAMAAAAAATGTAGRLPPPGSACAPSTASQHAPSRLQSSSSLSGRQWQAVAGDSGAWAMAQPAGPATAPGLEEPQRLQPLARSQAGTPGCSSAGLPPMRMSTSSLSRVLMQYHSGTGGADKDWPPAQQHHHQQWQRARRASIAADPMPHQSRDLYQSVSSPVISPPISSSCSGVPLPPTPGQTPSSWVATAAYAGMADAEHPLPQQAQLPACTGYEPPPLLSPSTRDLLHTLQSFNGSATPAHPWLQPPHAGPPACSFMRLSCPSLHVGRQPLQQQWQRQLCADLGMPAGPAWDHHLHAAPAASRPVASPGSGSGSEASPFMTWLHRNLHEDAEQRKRATVRAPLYQRSMTAPQTLVISSTAMAARSAHESAVAAAAVGGGSPGTHDSCHYRGGDTSASFYDSSAARCLAVQDNAVQGPSAAHKQLASMPAHEGSVAGGSDGSRSPCSYVDALVGLSQVDNFGSGARRVGNLEAIAESVSNVALQPLGSLRGTGSGFDRQHPVSSQDGLMVTQRTCESGDEACDELGSARGLPPLASPVHLTGRGVHAATDAAALRAEHTTEKPSSSSGIARGSAAAGAPVQGAPWSGMPPSAHPAGRRRVWLAHSLRRLVCGGCSHQHTVTHD